MSSPGPARAASKEGSAAPVSVSKPLGERSRPAHGTRAESVAPCVVAVVVVVVAHGRPAASSASGSVKEPR